jgi:SAM-dependent methyltransferase
MQDHSKTFARFHHQRWMNVNRQLTPLLTEYYQNSEPGRRKLPVLELGCGTGHVSLSFLEKGFRVTAVDPSENMLALARESATRFIDSGQANFVRSELDRAEVAEGFGLCLAVHDDFNHFGSVEALASCFGLARKAVTEEGLFLFDLHTRHGLQRLNNVIIEDNPQAMAAIRGIYDGERERLLVKFTGFLRAEDGRYDRFDELLVSHAFSLEQVGRALRDSGWGEFHFAKYTDLGKPLSDPEKVCRVFVVARRGQD